MDWYGDAISSETILETNPSCPTGNCTFPVFSSLAFCSNCIDITQSLQHSSNCNQHEGSYMKTEINENYNLPTSYPTMNCTYRLPSPSSGGNYSYFDDSGETSDIMVSWSVRKDNQPVVNAYNAPSFMIVFLPNADFSKPFQKSNGENIPSHFIAMVLIKFAPQTDSASLGLVSSAHICTLSVCAKEYNMSRRKALPRFNSKASVLQSRLCCLYAPSDPVCRVNCMSRVNRKSCSLSFVDSRVFEGDRTE